MCTEVGLCTEREMSIGPPTHEELVSERAHIMIPVTSLYAGLLTLGFLALSIAVITKRREAKVSLGHGGKPLLERRVRAQGNFAEYVPLSLVLMMLIEMHGGPSWWLHVLGVALIVGRILHATALVQEPENLAGRVAGMLLTFSVMFCAAGSLIAMVAPSFITP